MATQNIYTSLKQMTPLEVYLQRVKSCFDRLRKENQGYDYTPPQFGGVFGQRIVANAGAVLEVMDFEIE